MTGSEGTIRTARLSAVCAVTLVCALGASAAAQQDSTGTDPAKKPATAQRTAATSTTHKGTSSSTAHSSSSSTSSKTHTTSSKKRSSRKKTARLRGQQKIDSERAQAIQEALIREHYLIGTPTGEWNAASEAAMRRYQADNGWQSTVVPDSRALIKLGLGPSKDHLLNPESAMTTVPDPPKAESLPATAHTAQSASDPPPNATPNTTPQPPTPSQSSPSSPQ
jgi:hypothetical protein